MCIRDRHKVSRERSLMSRRRSRKVVRDKTNPETTKGCLENADLENADLQKRKKRRTRGFKFITLASKGCFCVCDTSVFSRSLFARSAFSRSACVFEVCGLRFRDTRLSFPVSLGGARNIFMPSNCESRGKSIIFNGAEFFPQM